MFNVSIATDIIMKCVMEIMHDSAAWPYHIYTDLSAFWREMLFWMLKLVVLLERS
jgi:hypothetical protein